MTDLWTEASFDHEAAAHEGALARAEAEFAGVFPFLAAARSQREYEHRKAIAAMRLQRIADVSGLPVAEVSQLADRHIALYFEAMEHTALPEGEDPLTPIVQAPAGQYGSGPEKPGGHHEGPDYSHGYSEVPQGPPGGPPPNVVNPIFGGPQVLSEPTASVRRTADATPAPAGGYSTLPAGVAQSTGSPDGLGAGGSMPAPAAGAADPVSQQVTAVARSVAASNPGLPEAECRRVARQAVGRFLQADLASSVYNDDPNGGSGPIGGGGHEHGGGNPAGHALEWQGAKSLMGGGEGAAAGGALAEAAELAVL